MSRPVVTTDLYYSAAWQVLEERVNGAVKTQYVWSPVYVDAMVLRDRDTDNNGSLDERLYPLQDANYNVTAVVSGTGAVVERYVYTPYGEATILTAGWSTISSSSVSWVYLHQGTRFDITIGLYHNRNRDYSPTLGRWISSDPLQFGAGDPNLYRANGNSPGNYVDPLGLRFEVGMDTANAIDGPGGGGGDSRGFWDRSDEALFKYGEGVREAAREQIIDPAIELWDDPLGTVGRKCVKIRDSSVVCWDRFNNGLGYIGQVGATAAANKFGHDMQRGGQLAVDVFMQNPSKNLGKLTTFGMMGGAGAAGGKLAVQLAPKVPGLVKHPAVGKFLADESGALKLGGVPIDELQHYLWTSPSGDTFDLLLNSKISGNSLLIQSGHIMPQSGPFLGTKGSLGLTGLRQLADELGTFFDIDQIQITKPIPRPTGQKGSFGPLIIPVRRGRLAP